MDSKARPYSADVLYTRDKTRSFSGPELLQIAMPLGGIGAGSICLNGHGGLQDYSIKNRPVTSAMGQSDFNVSDGVFALLHVKGPRPVTKLLEGPLPVEKIYDQGLQGMGLRQVGYEGLPRFENATFTGEYPFGHVQLADPEMPLSIGITGWNPFIPLDDKNSSLPCAILEYSFRNRTRRPVNFEFSFHSTHFGRTKQGEANTRNGVIPGGFELTNVEPPSTEEFGSAAVVVVGHRPLVKSMWLRGGWFDGISALWREVSEGKFTPNKATNAEGITGRNGASLLVSATVAPGESVTIPVVLAWYFPNVYKTYDVNTNNANCDDSAGCCPPIQLSAPAWRPYYAGQWKDAATVAAYVRKNYHSLRDRTMAFKNALFSSTFPTYVLDAVSANLGILKSPTVLRQENGNVWAWEGCFVNEGCCAGSCTHVWNYAQAMPHLFPQLERTLREQELTRSMNEHGHVAFRAALPDSPPSHSFHAAADGQLGGIMKLYRDWQIGGDTEWLRGLYPNAKRSLDYCIETWDPEHRGALFEPHHNTYDIEFWGPDGMCSSIYLGALAALAAMAHALDKNEDAEFYRSLAEKGAGYLDAELFNGKYYEQKVLWKELRDQSFTKQIAKVNRHSDEMLQLQKREGPKYQYGTGCLSDGVIGAWMSKIYGIDTPQSQANVRKNLQSIFDYNFRDDLFDHACLQRPGYAMGHEAGLLLCSWPRGGRPTLPFVYCDEVWTGFEYQVASHLIAEGLVDEGLTIVKAARDRYNGHVRNPWNEYECGSYYARAMSSYALLGALSGFSYSAVERTLWFGPRLEGNKFRSFFSTASGFGTIMLTESELIIEVLEGELHVERLVLTRAGATQQISCALQANPGSPARLKLPGRK